jgi:hypothetical protein
MRPPPDAGTADAGESPDGKGGDAAPPASGEAGWRGPGGAPDRRGRRRWLLLVAVALLGLLVIATVAVGVAVRAVQPERPGPFYTAPVPLPPGPPGTIIRSEAVHGFPHGAHAWRVLYKSTSYDGSPTAVSGTIIVPDSPAPAAGRNVLAYSHGTVGIASNCAPSLRGADLARLVPGFDAFVAAGDVLAITDYQGLGTRGPHPYLVGRSEAMGVLDSVRAAHNLPEAQAGTAFVVWGESQGGHAALFTGELAASYAPELTLLGVAALEPATDLAALFQAGVGTTFGDVLAAMAIRSWEQVYDAPSLEQVVTPAARPIVRQIATYCIAATRAQTLAMLPASTILKLTFLSQPPWDTEPWRSVAQQNTPGAMHIGVPLFISQGDADQIVSPQVTETFVRRLCAQGEAVQYTTYPGEGHITTPARSVADGAPWVADRFAGRPAPSSCGSP